MITRFLRLRDDGGTYTIRALTKELCVTARTLRFYEYEGLIAPERRGQMRVYSAHERARIIIILRSRRLGFSLKEVRELLRIYDYKDGEPDEVQLVLKKLKEHILVMEERRFDIEQTLHQLRRCVLEIENSLEGKSRTSEPQLLEYECSLSKHGDRPLS